MAKSPDDMAAAMIANLKEKTGKPLTSWLSIAGKTGATKHGELVKYLKTEHGLTHGYANLIAHKFLKSDAGSAESARDLVSNQYAGEKAALKPIYDAITKIAASFGDDVEIAPKKTYVSLRRSKQFAIIQPSTKSRVDVGLNLKGVKPSGRLEAAGSFNAMVTHRVRLETKADVDKDLKSWLKAAYQNA